MSGADVPFRSKRPLTSRPLPAAVLKLRSPATKSKKPQSNNQSMKSSNHSIRRLSPLPGISPLQIEVDPEEVDERPHKRLRNSKLDQFFPIEIRETTPIISTLPRPRKLRQGKLDSFFNQATGPNSSHDRSKRSRSPRVSTSRSLNSSMQASDAVVLSESEDEIEPDSPIVIPGYTDIDTNTLNQSNNQSRYDMNQPSNQSRYDMNHFNNQSWDHNGIPPAAQPICQSNNHVSASLPQQPTRTSMSDRIQAQILAQQRQQPQRQQQHKLTSYDEDDLMFDDESQYDAQSSYQPDHVPLISHQPPSSSVISHPLVKSELTSRCGPHTPVPVYHGPADVSFDENSLDIPLLGTIHSKVEPITEQQSQHNGSSFMFQNAPCDDDYEDEDDVPVFSFGAPPVKPDPEPVVKPDPMSASNRENGASRAPAVKKESAHPPVAYVSKLSLKLPKVKPEPVSSQLPTNLSSSAVVSSSTSSGSTNTVRSISDSGLPSSPPPLERMTQSQAAPTPQTSRPLSANDEIDLTEFSPAQPSIFNHRSRVKTETATRHAHPPPVQPVSPLPYRPTLPGPIGRIQRGENRSSIEPFSFDNSRQQLPAFPVSFQPPHVRQFPVAPPSRSHAQPIDQEIDYHAAPAFDDRSADSDDQYDPEIVIDDDDSALNEDEFEIHEDDFASDFDHEAEESASQSANNEFANTGFDTSYSFRRLSELRQTGDLAFDAEANLAAKSKRRESRAASTSARKSKASSSEQAGSDNSQQPRKALVGFWTGGKGGRAYHHPSGRVFTGRMAYVQYKKLTDKHPSDRKKKAAPKRKAKPATTKGKRKRSAAAANDDQSDRDDPPAKTKAKRKSVTPKSKSKPSQSKSKRVNDVASDDEAEWSPDLIDFD